jgi:acyl-CoA dehydrogenase
MAHANEREVFGDRIGSYQSIQHPLAEAHMRTTSARNLTLPGSSSVQGGPRRR